MPRDPLESGNNSVEHPQMDDVIKMAEKMDSELKELPMPSHIAVVNILMQCCEYRQNMIAREMQKKAQQEQREKQFSPHSRQ